MVESIPSSAPVTLAAALFLIGGWGTLVWGFFVSTVALWHSSFTINSLSHLFGRRRYETPDTSRNSLFLALLTFGEGWHNNHHAYPTSARHGLRWYEIDFNWLGIRALQLMGLARAIKRVRFNRTISTWQLVRSRIRSSRPCEES